MLKAGKRLTGLIAMLAVLSLLGGYANAAAPVNLHTWSQKGPVGNGTWTVSDTPSVGASVLQTINGDPTFFVSPNAFFNTTVQGSFGVETTYDDDFIGFVFGYQAPQGTGTDYDYILFDWKQTNQTGAYEGFNLTRVQGSFPSAGPHWDHADSGPNPTPPTPVFDVWATDYDTTKGWEDSQVYDFTLLYQSDRIKIDIQGGTGPFVTKQTIFDITPADVGEASFPSGQFGFYNYSQQAVRYQSFTQTDDPILQTNPDDGGTLDLGSVRVGTTSAPGDLTVTNAAVVGSTLTGTVGAASGEFAGPTPDAGFVLTEGANTVKQFTYTPTARGADTQDIAVTSDGGNNTVTLAGKGVEPVYADDSGGEIDFGTRDSSDPATMLLLRLFNNSTDTETGDLTDLTILSATITGDDAGLFDLLGFTPGTVIARGSFRNLQVEFDPTGAAVNDKTALLTFTTDQGAAVGTAGETFEIDLKGKIIPEPTTVSLLVLGAVALIRRRRR